MSFYFVMENKEIEKAEITFNNVFSTVESIQDLIEKLEKKHKCKVETIDGVIIVPALHASGAKYLHRMGAILKHKGEETLINFIAKPDEISSYLLLIFAGIDLGEKYEKLQCTATVNQKSIIAAKQQAQHNAKSGIVNRQCSLVKFIAEKTYGVANAEAVIKTVNLLEGLPNKKEKLAEAYLAIYGEPVPNPKKAQNFDPKVWTDDEIFSKMMNNKF